MKKLKLKLKLKLSILICTINGREKKLDRLLQILDKQKNRMEEILIEKDDKQMTTGAKRNILLQKAKGDYVAFIDDDDTVSEDYIPQILKAVRTNPDCVGIQGIINSRATNTNKKFTHSIKYKSWFSDGVVYYRCPNHLNPIKRSIALSVGFPNITKQEDKAFSLAIRPLLKTEVCINNILYYYWAS